jgi:hypothetical protein
MERTFNIALRQSQVCLSCGSQGTVCRQLNDGVHMGVDGFNLL